eukprot:gene28198-31294_t
MDTAPRMTRSRAKAMGDGSTTPAAVVKPTRGSKTTAGKAVNKLGTFTPAAVSKLAFSEKERNDTSEDSDQNKVVEQELQLSPLPEVLSVDPLPEVEEQTPDHASDQAEVPSAPAPAPETEVVDADAHAEDMSAEEPTPAPIEAVEPEQALEVQQPGQDDMTGDVIVDAVPPPSALKPQLLSAIKSMEEAVAAALGETSPAPPCAGLSPGVQLQPTPCVGEQMSPTLGNGEVQKRVSISTPMVSHAVTSAKKGIVYTPYPKSEGAEADEEMGDVDPSNLGDYLGDSLYGDSLYGDSPMAGMSDMPDMSPMAYMSPLSAILMAPSAAVTPTMVATPTMAATPKATNPKATTPRAATPKVATPKAATPKAATPKAATPMTATPKAATPKAVTPKAATPLDMMSPAFSEVPQEMMSPAPFEAPMDMMSPAFPEAPQDMMSPAPAPFEAPLDMMSPALSEAPMMPSPSMASASEQKLDSELVSDLMEPEVSEQEAAIIDQVASKSMMKSTVAVASPYDPRSIRQLKKEIKAAYAKQEVKGLLEDDGETEAEFSENTGDLLASAMGDMSIGAPQGPLRGLPLPQGTHVRFDDEGMMTGSHVRFDDEDA